jgi:pimeloyl-ACP methyl ester carboxylesterase
MSVPTSTHTTRNVDLADGLTLTVDEYGTNSDGSGVLILHGGAGPRTVIGLASALSNHTYAIAPTHPGFDGTPRPDWTTTVADLATAYLDLLDALGVTDVMVIGNSIGGWIAAEMALRDTHRRIKCLTLLNAVGIRPDHTDDIVDPRTLAPADIPKLSFANPALLPDPATLTDEQKAGMAANQKALAIYGGEYFTYDQKLRGRLHRVAVPVLVAWGEQDGIASSEYGRTYASAFPDGHFTPIPNAGHLPHIEQLAHTLAAIRNFVDTVVKPS